MANVDLVADRHYKKAKESGRAKDVDMGIRDSGQVRIRPADCSACACTDRVCTHSQDTTSQVLRGVHVWMCIY